MYLHPVIRQYAQILGRTPSALNMKIGNIGRLDPDLYKKGISGLVHGAKMEEEVWNEFYGNPELLAFESEKIILLNKEDCNFEYRKSIFKNDGFIILGAEIKLKKQKIEDSNNKIEKRIEYCKNNQDWGKGCFGSCFSNFSPKILKIVSLFYRNKKGVRMASNNSNWLVNDGTGSYKDAITIIKRCCFLHRILHRDIEREVIIWK